METAKEAHSVELWIEVNASKNLKFVGSDCWFIGIRYTDVPIIYWLTYFNPRRKNS